MSATTMTPLTARTGEVPSPSRRFEPTVGVATPGAPGSDTGRHLRETAATSGPVQPEILESDRSGKSDRSGRRSARANRPQDGVSDLLTVLIAAVAGVASWAGLVLLGEHAYMGTLGPVRISWLLALTVDASALVALRSWINPAVGPRVRSWSRAVASVALGVSIVGNALGHVLHHSEAWLLTSLVSAVPPLALFAVLHLRVLRMQDRHAAQPDRSTLPVGPAVVADRSSGVPATGPEADRSVETVQSTSTDRSEVNRSATRTDRSTTSAPQTGPNASSSRSVRPVQRSKPQRRTGAETQQQEKARAYWREQIALGRNPQKITGAELAQAVGDGATDSAGRKWARKFRAEQDDRSNPTNADRSN